jgi:hypothetical protein
VEDLAGVLGLHNGRAESERGCKELVLLQKVCKPVRDLLSGKLRRIPNEYAALSAISRRICLALCEIARNLGGRLHRVQCGSEIALI